MKKPRRMTKATAWSHALETSKSRFICTPVEFYFLLNVRVHRPQVSTMNVIQGETPSILVQFLIAQSVYSHLLRISLGRFYLCCANNAAATLKLARAGRGCGSSNPCRVQAYCRAAASARRLSRGRSGRRATRMWADLPVGFFAGRRPAWQPRKAAPPDLSTWSGLSGRNDGIRAGVAGNLQTPAADLPVGFGGAGRPAPHFCRCAVIGVV